MKLTQRNFPRRSFPTHFKRSLVFIAVLTCMTSTFANPVAPVVSAGGAVITQTPGNTQIQQSTQNAIIDWKSFNIGVHEKTNFQQPANGVTLNRINSNYGASQIYGALTATGRLILVNAAGIYFGPTAMVNVGSIIASTTDISNTNFMAGQYIFDQPTTMNSKIINAGMIKVADNGLVALVGANVTNTGLIQANLGTVILATGDKFTFDFFGDQLINFSVDQATSQSGKIMNNGAILANGGKILISAQTASQVLDNTINMNGVLQANSVSQQNGDIILEANNGGVNIRGDILAEGQIAGTNGGNISISSKYINIASGAKVSVSGDAGGGNITFGFTDANGNPTNAVSITTNFCSHILANSFANNSFAGNITMYADNVSLQGSLESVGLGQGSSGGNVNLYGNNVDLEEGAFINASGQFGGSVNLGGNPYTTSGKTTSSFVDFDLFTYVAAQGLGLNSSGGSVNASGDLTLVGGVIDVSARSTGSSGGSVQLSGQNVHLQSFSIVNASGDVLGGSIILGVNPALSIPTSATINVDASSYLSVAAHGTNALGGTLSVFGDDVNINGVLNASAGTLLSNSMGGRIKVIANNSVTLGSRSIIDADGDGGGGEIFIGGDPSSSNPIANFTTVNPGSIISASAITNGNGGLVTVYSNNTTDFGGSIFAKGGVLGGNGGSVLIQGLQLTNYHGTSDVSAPQGTPGTIVIASP